LKALIIDSHIHLDIIFTDHPDQISWLKANRIFPVSWAFSNHIESLNDLRNYLKQQASIIQKLNATTLPCRFLAGIHPRNIPSDLAAKDVGELLIPFLKDPLCLGMGEIGLESGNEKEVEIMTAQLALADTIKSMNKKIGIHTPRKNKTAITIKLLELLQDFSGIEPFTVIDHCSPETISGVLERGYQAGVTLSPEKTSVEELKHMIQTFPANLDRIMCNTDSCMTFSKDLHRFFTDHSVADEIRNALCFKNASGFFNLIRC